MQNEGKASPRDQLINKMPLELQILMQSEDDDKIYSLMGFSRTDYLKYLQECKYLRSHGLQTQQQENIYKNADISRKFFNIIDQNNEGGISDKEFANPLISLGLATDPGFVRKVMRILAPKKFRSSEDYKEEELTLKEFANLFKSDPIGDRLVKAIRDEIMQARQAKAENARKREILQRRSERLAREAEFDYDRINLNLQQLQMCEHDQMQQARPRETAEVVAEGRARLEKKVSFTMDQAEEDLLREQYAASHGKHAFGRAATRGTSQYNLFDASRLELNSSGLLSSGRASQSLARQQSGILRAKGAHTALSKGPDVDPPALAYRRAESFDQTLSRKSEDSVSSRIPAPSSTSPKRESKSPAKAKRARPKGEEVIDINDQVAVIQDWWRKLGASKMSTMKSLEEVSEMFIQRRIFAD